MSQLGCGSVLPLSAADAGCGADSIDAVGSTAAWPKFGRKWPTVCGELGAGGAIRCCCGPIDLNMGPRSANREVVWASGRCWLDVPRPEQAASTSSGSAVPECRVFGVRENHWS
jgi:hypothetical protein